MLFGHTSKKLISNDKLMRIMPRNNPKSQESPCQDNERYYRAERGDKIFKTPHKNIFTCKIYLVWKRLLTGKYVSQILLTIDGYFGKQ